jgi:iron complex outermembrane receptor protein
MNLQHRTCGLLLAALGAAGHAAAQSAEPAPAPTPVPAPAPAPAAPPGATQRVEITGGRDSDDEQRRRSSAAKIVIGREEIDKFGDSTLGEVLRRLPGVTTPGAPGRGGPPRLRGLGGGYTQLLIDGQRIPPGFSLESLTPEQVERIEILRAPTAETGARAIAGTINIITREGLRRRLNDLRGGLAFEGGTVSPGLNWTRNDSAGALTWNVSGSVFRNDREVEATTLTLLERTVEDGTASTTTQQQRSELARGSDRRNGVHLGGRLQWRLGEAGDSLMLMPNLFHTENRGHRLADLSDLTDPGSRSLYDYATVESTSRFTNARLGGQWRTRLGASRLEAGGQLGGWQAFNGSVRREFGAAAGDAGVDDLRRTRERTAQLNLKLTSLLGGDAARPGSEHSLVAGAEVEGARRSELRDVTRTGAAVGAFDEDGADNLRDSSLRLALYAQDEWNLTPQWSLNAGLRWEGIETRGESDDGGRPLNRSSVATPLLHLLWKPDPKGRDQFRLSLTRSYKSPGLGSLIARRSIHPRHPADGPNEPLEPDRVGNPDLRPELARGVDLAVERYPAGGGVLSANLFVRRITDLIRSETTLRDVPWSPVPRWVAEDVNIGGARTWGLELEAKFRLDQLAAGAPRTDVRANASFYRSRVEGVPGPDNRLDQQAPATVNLGADHRLRGTPLAVGGNFNWVPGYRTRLSQERWASVSPKRVFDLYGVWTFSPAAALRLTASNLAAQDTVNGSLADYVVRTDDGAGGVRTTRLRNDAVVDARSWVNWQLRLELKL